MFAVLAALSATLLTQDKPAVDRSAEPALKQLFADAAALPAARFLIQNYGLETRAGRYTQGSSMEVSVAKGGKFRVMTSDDMWGGASLYVSDGSSVLTDGMDNGSPVVITKSGQPLHEIVDQPFFYMLEGPTMFDKLVDSDKPVKFVSGTEPEKAIEFRSKSKGRIVVYYPASSPFPLPTKIETFQTPWWADEGQGEWPQAMNRDVIRLVKLGKLDPTEFSVEPAKGRTVVDMRLKKVGQ